MLSALHVCRFPCPRLDFANWCSQARRRGRWCQKYQTLFQETKTLTYDTRKSGAVIELFRQWGFQSATGGCFGAHLCRHWIVGHSVKSCLLTHIFAALERLSGMRYDALQATRNLSLTGPWGTGPSDLGDHWYPCKVRVWKLTFLGILILTSTCQLESGKKSGAAL